MWYHIFFTLWDTTRTKNLKSCRLARIKPRKVIFLKLTKSKGSARYVLSIVSVFIYNAWSKLQKV
jgi:hypothetical protein